MDLLNNAKGSIDNRLIAPTTYIKKETFIEILNKLDFYAIESANIEFITMFKLDDKENTVLPRGFKIEIR